MTSLSCRSMAARRRRISSFTSAAPHAAGAERTGDTVRRACRVARRAVRAARDRTTPRTGLRVAWERWSAPETRDTSAASRRRHPATDVRDSRCCSRCELRSPRPAQKAADHHPSAASRLGSNGSRMGGPALLAGWAPGRGWQEHRPRVYRLSAQGVVDTGLLPDSVGECLVGDRVLLPVDLAAVPDDVQPGPVLCG